MKLAKKLAALLLTLALAFSLALPAFAETDAPAMMPIITRQPKNHRMRASTRGTYDLGIYAYIPNGDPVMYRLYSGDEFIEEMSSPYINTNYESGEYHFIIYNSANPEYCVTSNTFRVDVYEPSGFEAVFLAFAEPIWTNSFTPWGLIGIPRAFFLAWLDNLLFPYAY